MGRNASNIVGAAAWRGQYLITGLWVIVLHPQSTISGVWLIGWPSVLICAPSIAKVTKRCLDSSIFPPRRPGLLNYHCRVVCLHILPLPLLAGFLDQHFRCTGFCIVWGGCPNIYTPHFDNLNPDFIGFHHVSFALGRVSGRLPARYSPSRISLVALQPVGACLRHGYSHAMLGTLQTLSHTQTRG